MTNKEVLKDLTFDVNDLLSEYIAIHNDRLKRAGTLVSFLKNLFLDKKIDFNQITNDTALLLGKFESKERKFTLVKNTFYKRFDGQEKEFFECLTQYFDALYLTCKSLARVAEYQHLISQSSKNASWSKNKQLEENYQESIKNYYALGEQLNILYGKLFSI